MCQVCISLIFINLCKKKPVSTYSNSGIFFSVPSVAKSMLAGKPMIFIGMKKEF
jgi:hypothetical protein